jgi:hypothetical protein
VGNVPSFVTGFSVESDLPVQMSFNVIEELTPEKNDFR